MEQSSAGRACEPPDLFETRHYRSSSESGSEDGDEDEDEDGEDGGVGESEEE